jgi:hypothetical protein
MGSHHSAINDKMLQVWVLNQMLMHSFPDALITPAGKPPVDAVPFAILFGQQSPLSAAAGHPEHPLNEAAAVGFWADVYLRTIPQEVEDF